HDAAQARIRDGRARLSLRVVTRTDGERHSESPVYRGRTVQQPPVRHQRPERQTGGGT
ncbi:hypothetical protein M9458_054720, partial [Cirrhinus mrigala]